MDELAKYQGGYEPDEITDAMTAAALRVLRNSGALEYEYLVNETLMRRVLKAALDARPTTCLEQSLDS
jgi:hypothetical protein